MFPKVIVRKQLQGGSVCYGSQCRDPGPQMATGCRSWPAMSQNITQDQSYSPHGRQPRDRRVTEGERTKEYSSRAQPSDPGPNTTRAPAATVPHPSCLGSWNLIWLELSRPNHLWKCLCRHTQKWYLTSLLGDSQANQVNHQH